MALSRGAMGLSAVCDCGISRSYSLTIYDVTTTLQSLWTRGRQCTSHSLASLYSVETLHAGLAWPMLGPFFRVSVSPPTCKQGCTGDGNTSPFACCGLDGVV